MEDRIPALPHGLPTPRRPLLGLTLLLVEDSRFACEAMRLMCLRSGARLRRADCLSSARRHLQVYRPSGIIVDIGLPDGSGLDLIEELSAARPRIGVILGLSGEDHALERAMEAGADGCLAKPLESLAKFQQTVLASLPPDRQPHGPRPVQEQPIIPDTAAYREDIAHVADLLEDGREGPVLDYVAQFLKGVAQSARDTPLADAARDLARSRRDGQPGDDTAVLARLEALVQERVGNRAAI